MRKTLTQHLADLLFFAFFSSNKKRGAGAADGRAIGTMVPAGLADDVKVRKSAFSERLVEFVPFHHAPRCIPIACRKRSGQDIRCHAAAYSSLVQHFFWKQPSGF